MTVHCGQCNHEWEMLLKLPMEVSRWCRAVKGLTLAGCPECGAFGKDVLLGPRFTSAQWGAWVADGRGRKKKRGGNVTT